MVAQDLSRLTTESTIGEVVGSTEALDVSARGKDLADLLRAKPEIPGVLLTRDGRVRTAVSRAYYLDTVGRYLGMDLYLPRPVGEMLESFEEHGGAFFAEPSVPVSEAVRLGLTRHRALVYEPIIVRTPGAPGALGAKLVDFHDLLLADSHLTRLRAHQTRQILATVREGLLLVGPDRRLLGEHSNSIAELLGTRRIGGRTLPDLLAEGLDAERCDLAASYVDSLFEPRVIERLIAQVNPLLEATWRGRSGAPKTLAFRFARGVEEGEIRRVLVRIEDVTRAREMAAEVERERLRAERQLTLAVAAARLEPDRLAAFLAALEAELHRASELGHDATAPPAEIERLRRRLHALKGEAGMSKLDAFESRLHALEDELEPLRDGGEVDLVSLEPKLAALGELVDEARELSERLTGRRPAREARPPDGAADGAEAMGAIGAIEGLAELAATVARDCGKRVRLVRDVDPALVAAHAELVREALVQLVRNAVVHGIETPEARARAGKPPEGTIQIVTRREEASGWTEVIVQDDGRGLDIEALGERARAAGVEVGGEELATLVFHSGISTAAEVTPHAGRGVGLDLVRDRVEAAGAAIEVHSEPARFCAFRILLPAASAAA
jgi:signal transduction histidine kinase